MAGDPPLLVADIGGTNARFALAVRDGEAVHISDVQRFLAEDYESPRDAADAFLESVGGRPTLGAFAIAAPVRGDVIPFTNSHWSLDIPQTEKALGLQKLTVVNDFHALAAGVPHLPSEAFQNVREAEGDPSAPRVVIGPGTGLGQALIVPTGKMNVIVPTEGGHVHFAPTDEREVDVWRFIAKEHPRVSVERVLSGRGLVNLHRALCQRAGVPRVSLQASEIAESAASDEFPIAGEAVGLFCAILGSVAGDAVLSAGARGGVYIGGGIIPKIYDAFVASTFIDRFNAKGRMRPYVEDVPIRLIKDDDVALYGAASLAAR